MKHVFTKANIYEESYAGPYEGSNDGLNEIPNENMNKNYGIIALMIKKHVEVLA